LAAAGILRRLNLQLLLLGILIGLWGFGFWRDLPLLLAGPPQYDFSIDFHAGQAINAGFSPYSISGFIYPPFFAILGAIGSFQAQLALC
jgi:hypothetical protein